MSDAPAPGPANPAPGHNQGPPLSDWSDELHPAVLRDQWDLDYPELKTRRDELLAGYTRFEQAVKEITDDVMDAKATDFVDQFEKLEKRAEAARKVEKAPFDAAAAAVQRYFKADILDPLELRRKKIKALQTAYKVAKDTADRKVREAEAKRIAEEAAAVAAKAELTNSIEDINDAGEAAAAADKALRAALATNPAASRVRGAGATSYLRTTYTIVVEDESLLPDEYTKRVADESKLLAALRAAELLAGDGPPQLQIPGARIVPSYQTVNRS